MQIAVLPRMTNEILEPGRLNTFSRPPTFTFRGNTISVKKSGSSSSNITLNSKHKISSYKSIDYKHNKYGFGKALTIIGEGYEADRDCEEKKSTKSVKWKTKSTSL